MKETWCKFLQRFVRGMDMSKLVQFLKFTTGMNILVGKNIEVTFIKCEGLGIAHTCGPVHKNRPKSLESLKKFIHQPGPPLTRCNQYASIL